MTCEVTVAIATPHRLQSTATIGNGAYPPATRTEASTAKAAITVGSPKPG